MRGSGRDCWRLVRRSQTLFLVAGGMAFCLSTSQPRLARSHDMHQHQHPIPKAEPETKSSPGKMSIPDVTLVNQRGEPIQFYTDLIKDKVVAINFIFTTCTTICPPMGANFAQLQKLMTHRVGKDVHFISVSVDPVTDTPQHLMAWSQRFNAAPGWTLVTGSRHEVVTLLKALEVYTADKLNHAPVVLLGNETTGQWRRTYGLAPPSTLADIIADLSGPAKESSLQEGGHK
jgi:protein SCO1